MGSISGKKCRQSLLESAVLLENMSFNVPCHTQQAQINQSVIGTGLVIVTESLYLRESEQLKETSWALWSCG